MLNFLNLDITPGGVPPVLHMGQYETGRSYQVTLKDGGGDYTLRLGATAVVKGFNGRTPWQVDATVDGATITFAQSAAMTDQFGMHPATIEITESGDMVTPLLMLFDIQRAGYTSEEAARSPEFATAMEEAVAGVLSNTGVLLAENQATKTLDMTQAVGVDANGKLWVKPSGGGGGGTELFVVTINSQGQTDASSDDIYSAWQLGYVIKLRKSPIEYELQGITSSSATFSTTIDTGTGVLVDSYTITGTTVTHNQITGAANPTVEYDHTSTSKTIAQAADNTIYDYGELTALSVTAVASGASFILCFDSPGGTPTVLTLPAAIQLPADFQMQPYGHYEINVRGNYALVAFWPFDD